MWLSDATVWTWERLWPLEESFWDAAPDALSAPRRPVLAQAAREMLLAQSSDWQFIISTGAAADYAERRFRQHCDDAEALLAALAPAPRRDSREAQRRPPRSWTGATTLPPTSSPPWPLALGGSRALAFG